MFWGVKIKIIFIETDFLLSKKFVMPNNEKICCSYTNSSIFLWLYANLKFHLGVPLFSVKMNAPGNLCPALSFCFILLLHFPNHPPVPSYC